jgi:hypothetical protein
LLRGVSQNGGSPEDLLYHADVSAYPKDLAEAVVRGLRDRGLTAPSQKLLNLLFETMYFASLRTEEAQSIVFHVVWLDPSKPDPYPPERIVRDRWAYVPLGTAIPVSVSTWVKIALASDPRSSSFAVYPDSSERLSIWGLTDQGNRIHEFMHGDFESGAERPGLFQASIMGPGHITVYCQYERIADLNVDRLSAAPIDALGGGPLREALLHGIHAHVEEVYEAVDPHAWEARGHWRDTLVETWLTAIRRLLSRIRSYGHGGAVLITPDGAPGLSVKYEVKYPRLRTALTAGATSMIQKTAASDKIFELCLDVEASHIPASLYLEESVSTTDYEESQSEIDGALWFVSLLSRVDGLVMMSPRLELRGFGVEIIVVDVPTALARAGDQNASPSMRTQLDYNHFGTRHRSMMRYCAAVPGSVGFVVSQDGDVRAMTSVDGELLFWDDLALKLDIPSS